MPEIGINARDIKSLNEQLDKVIQKFPELRKQLHEQMGLDMLSVLRAQISNSGMQSGGGRLHGWQKHYIGSRGGYAAVRAAESPSGKDGAGAITNYNEGGHRVRQPRAATHFSNTGLKRPPDKNRDVKRVEGYHFYNSANKEIDATFQKAADEFLEKISALMEG